MNVTEKQKEILIAFMQKYPDFGRGRLRYNNENKRKIDELWEKLSSVLNTTGCGPCKTAKEWAKTWRDWKSNTLKKVSKHKSYMTSTGGGSPQHLHLTTVEKSLMEFLTPDASGLSGIPEGGIQDTNLTPNFNEQNIYVSSDEESTHNTYLHGTYKKNSTIQRKQPLTDGILDPVDSILQSIRQKRSLDQDIRKDKYFSSSSRNQDIIKIKQPLIDDILDPVDSILQSIRQKSPLNQDIKEDKYFSSLSRNQDIPIIGNEENVFEKKETLTTSKDNIKKRTNAKKLEDIKKPRLMATAIDLLEKKSSNSETIKQKMLTLKEKRLELSKEKLIVHKDILQQLQNINKELSCLKEHFVGQYLEEFEGSTYKIIE